MATANNGNNMKTNREIKLVSKNGVKSKAKYMECNNCKETTDNVSFHTLSKERLCRDCMEEKIKCYKCNEITNNITFYISSKETWCDNCQEDWQENEMWKDKMDRDEIAIENFKIDRRIDLKNRYD